MSFDQAEITYAIADRLNEMVESGSKTMPLMPWHTRGCFPVNMHSNAAYNGSNVMRLWGHAEHRGYVHDRWATFKQINALEAKVKKGEAGTFILKFVPEERNEAGQVVHDSYVRKYLVWNVEQTTLPPTPRAGSPVADDKLADRAYMKVKKKLGKGSGNVAYDALVCDIGAAFLLARDGFRTQPRADHAKYARGWLAFLKIEGADATSLTLWTASSEAAKIVEALQRVD